MVMLSCGTVNYCAGHWTKKSVGSGTKDNLFHVLLRDFSPATAGDRMCRLSKLCGRWLGTHGFSIGISDVWPSDVLQQRKHELVKDGYRQCRQFMEDLENGTLQPQPGFSADQTLESKMTKSLSDVRAKAGNLCMDELHHLNSPLIMAKCGSKGGQLNISQMAACVGQQTIMGARIPNGFIGRTLPHFAVNEKSPMAKGFVRNSFFSGLTPTEFFFHTMAGREGLVDTAVKTADTGYMQRRLMKALEDMTINYDDTVRNSESTVIQFTYGDDGLDPLDMEAKNAPLSFQHVLEHVQNIYVAYDDGREFATVAQLYKEVRNGFSRADFKEYTTKKVTESLLEFFFGATLVKSIESSWLPPQTWKEGDTGPPAPPDVSMLYEAFMECANNFERLLEDLCVRLSEVGGLFGTVIETQEKFLSIYDSSDASYKSVVVGVYQLTIRQLKVFFDTVVVKLRRARVEPGTTVGAIAGQSIGEPATQMTLKTFHFAGVATMNITLGVPRIKEIINAAKTISTPIITAKLDVENDIQQARVVKARVEKTTLGEISLYIKVVFNDTDPCIRIKLDRRTLQALQMDITARTVSQAIQAIPRAKITEQHIRVQDDYHLMVLPKPDQTYYGLQQLRALLPSVIVRGIPDVSRAVISDVGTEGEGHKYVMMAEGYSFQSVMTTLGVRGYETVSNHIIEMEQVLGIEAARASIIEQIIITMQHHSISVDIRHVTLLADVMTFKGQVLGITRHGVGKMRESVLTLASFETPTDHLLDAAVHSRQDKINGVSDSVLLGNPMPVGTGLFKMLRLQDSVTTVKKAAPTLFETCLKLARGEA
mmetsp:Transcript_28213/g.78904  ORF Transcript_28213/g.78904 Transcript_28213/m.78904 type:complete len:822 (+) Transcript_28213:920-3385(+)